MISAIYPSAAPAMLSAGSAALSVVCVALIVGDPASAMLSGAAEAMQAEAAAAPESEIASSFVPADFDVPTLVEANGFKLVPLGPELVKIDFDAYMSSIEYLQKTFTRSTSWPHKDISDADALQDMENEQARFQKRTSFAFAVLTPDGGRERGTLYISPGAVDGYDAVVRMWVTKAEYDAGIDAELYAWATDWLQTSWPFEKIAYPGRAIDWTTWDAMVAAAPAKDAAQDD